MNAPNPAWLPFLKLTYGAILLLVIAILAAIIALGKVEASTSHGLEIVLGSLTTLAGGFAQWCFKGGDRTEDVK